MLHVISEAVFASIARITYQTKLKIFLLTCYSRKQNLFLLPLYTNLKLIVASWSTYLRDSMILIKWKMIYLFLAILILTFLILDKYKDMSKRKSNFGAIPKKYAQICSTSGLKQLLKHPTRTTCHTSTLLDHVIIICEEKVTRSVVIDTSLSDHQLVFCTRDIKRAKTNNHKQISFRSLKNY